MGAHQAVPARRHTAIRLHPAAIPSPMLTTRIPSPMLTTRARQAVLSILRDDGPRGFYRGIVPR